MPSSSHPWRVALRVDGRQVGQSAHLLISVQDTGPGIAPSDLERIFNRFQQACAGQDVSSEGVGLGLAISREIIDLMGGHLSVESTRQGLQVLVQAEIPVLKPVDTLELPESANGYARPTSNPACR